MSKPRFAHWLKYHHCVLQWLPFGGRIWRWTDATMEQWHESEEVDRREGDVTMASLGPSWILPFGWSNKHLGLTRQQIP